MSYRTIIITGGILGLLGVVLGAMGAHLLKDTIGPEFLGNYKTGAEYQMYHAVLLLFTGIAIKNNSSSLLKISAVCTIAGVILFSGSLYLLSITHNKALGMITPFGGLAFMGGWVCMILHFLTKEKNS